MNFGIGKFKLKRQYIYIYLIIFIIFSLFYITMFIFNRLNHLNYKLHQEREYLTEIIYNKVTLNAFAFKQQLRYFINYSQLIEFFYKNNKDELEYIFNKNQFYDYLVFISSSGKYLYQSNNKFKGKIELEQFENNDINASIIYDDKEAKTYRVLSYPVVINNKLEGYIVSYLDITYLLDTNDTYLISQDGYLLNDTYMNEIYMGHKNLSFVYPEAWNEILKNTNGQLLTDRALFTYHELGENIDIQASYTDKKISKGKFYLVSIINIDQENSPYHINSMSSFFKYINFKINIQYWIIGYIWIFLTSIILFRGIIAKIKSSELSNLDAMTGAYNRHKGFMKLDNLIKKFNSKFESKILDKLPFMRQVKSIHFCMIDIDNLKHVNDTLGHKYGDELIITTINIIRKKLNNMEFIIRMGGDEFLLIFINRTNDSITDFWKNITMIFNDKNNSRILKYNINTSHGVAEYKAYDDIESCIVKADELMYQEKRSHKVNLFFQ